MQLHAHVQHLLTDYLNEYPSHEMRLAPAYELLKLEDPIHRKEWRGHFTASLLTLNAARTRVRTSHHVLLNRRLCPGGHIDEDGNPFDTALREAQEEVGLPLEGLVPLNTWSQEACAIDIDIHGIGENVRKQEPPHMHYDILYAVQAPKDVALIPVQDEGVYDLQWTPLSEWMNFNARNQRMMEVLLRYQLVSMDVNQQAFASLMP